MDAIYHLYGIPLLLLLLSIIGLLTLLLVPSKIFRNKKLGWRIYLLAIFGIGAYIWFYVQPEHYEKKYLENEIAPFEPLKNVVGQRNFYIGAAISNSKERMQFAKPYFNSLTLENELKYGRLIGKDLKTYDFSQVDPLVEFAQKNNMRIRGHVLVWGRAADYFKSPDLRTILKDVPKDKMPDTLKSLIKSHITKVLTRYKGKIAQWDCVNEPLNVFDGGFDENIYYEHLGKGYIKDAFKWAHELDPDVELFLNEQFDQYDSEKAQAFLRLVKEMVDEGIPIHGVGIQSHVMFQIPKIEPFKEFLNEIAKLDLKIEVTELDARLRLFNGFEDPYQAQGDFYERFTKACHENPKCTGITFWGVSDKYCWFDELGVFKLHKPNEALLFDKEMNPKPAYLGVMNALKIK